MYQNEILWYSDIYQDVTTKNKKIILIAGASASGKSYNANKLCDFLKNKGLNAICFSADNYYKGISRILVEKAILENEDFKRFESKKEFIIATLRSVIENTPFVDKFNATNCEKLKEAFSGFGKNKSQYICESLQKQFNKINFDEPFAVNLNLLSKDINKLLNKKSIVVPNYSFATGESTLNSDNSINGNCDVYIIEGLYVLRDEVLEKIDKSQVCPCLVECNTKTLLSRRFNRDIKSGRTTFSPEQTIMSTLTKVMPSYIINILPYNKNSMFTLKTNITNNEIEQKEHTSQVKYKLNKNQIKALKILNIYLKNKETQTDYYFEDKTYNKDFILRLRVKDGNAIKITFKNNLISTRMVEEYNLTDFSEENKDPKNLISAFENLGLTISSKLTKTRHFVVYNNNKFKVDYFDDGNIFIEIDNPDNCKDIISILKLKNGSLLPYKDLNLQSQKYYEKEFKFIVDKIPQKYCKKILKINQFYFNFQNKSEFLEKLNLDLSNVSSARVRVITENNIKKYYLTLKSSGTFSREEQELEITKNDAIYLLKDNIISQIFKTRKVVIINGITFEFDEFKSGLILAEVEVENSEPYDTIIETLKQNNIKFKDVTNNSSFKNENLAK